MTYKKSLIGLTLFFLLLIHKLHFIKKNLIKLIHSTTELQQSTILFVPKYKYICSPKNSTSCIINISNCSTVLRYEINYRFGMPCLYKASFFILKLSETSGTN